MKVAKHISNYEPFLWLLYLLHAGSEVDSQNLPRKPTFKFILSAPDCLGYEERFIDCIPPPAIFESFVCINNTLSILYCAGS